MKACSCCSLAKPELPPPLPLSCLQQCMGQGSGVRQGTRASVVWFSGQEPWYVCGNCTYGELSPSGPPPPPPVGPDNEVMVGRSGRNVGLLNLAV